MRLHALAFLPAFALLGMTVLAAAPRGKPDLVWPNAESSANSDEWLVKNHDRIKQMRPRLLVINYMNGLSQKDALGKVDRLIGALRESSRYHGYEDATASPFLEYQVAKFVDMTDPAPLPADRRMEGNSSLYPRQEDKGDSNFRYDALFSKEYAERYGYKDASGKAMDLKALVDKGIVNEVWFIANQGDFGAPFESVEVKQMYDAKFAKLPGKHVQAGNGGSSRQPWIGRSLRILFINATRGPGCAMESLGHSFEWMATENPVPYFHKYFMEFADFDLEKRYGLPFSKLYAREGTDLDFPDPTTMTYTWKGEKRTVKNYVPRGGSVHFTPNGRRDYDLSNTQPVMTTIEHYRRHDGAGGRDKAELYTNEKIANYRKMADDCMGPWLVYWRQNMPGLENRSVDDGGKAMKNWWPFLFY